MNQTTSTQPGGMLRLAGTTNEAANVTIAGQPAQLLPGNRFQGETPVGSGTTSVPVVATDGSGNARTYTYNVSVSGSTKTLTYDSNGNLLTDGLRTYTWDALDQLIAIDQGAHRSEFTYDGEGRRVRVVEREASVVQEDRRFIWQGMEIAEERDAAGTTLKRHLSGGLQQGGANYFLTSDHLGSTREMTDTTAATRARYDFDPYGRPTKTAGDLDSDLGFGATTAHGATGLSLAVYRAYDPALGRWLNQDPIGLAGGLNLYAYVGGRPTRFSDPSGLEAGNLNRLVPGPNGEVASGGGVDNSALGTVMGIIGVVGIVAIFASMAIIFGPTLYLAAHATVISAQAAQAPAACNFGGRTATVTSAQQVNAWASTPTSGITTETITAYRVWGGSSVPSGAWLTPTAPVSRAAAISTLSLPPGNAATHISQVTIPAGTRIMIGPAAPVPQWGGTGGALQIQLQQSISTACFGPPIPLK